ncbi:carboxymuconolactone decarboxylase family protein [Saccharothrix australiensis]|uniref:AhpD family alkylhydroperoxidase n=1 Tax=Saccharothrix australiensis TaxID=2072 RepID=A0A495W2F5_9PSEU|nr:carboxymuconolactone decarboxylase family protein [Saccharothrix australiensis]RKT55207.1 AhpD family alkylhydroperoxidase [Saccharothrix australiensis]
MLGTLVQAGLRGLSTAQVRQVRPVRYGAARGDVARIYRELERDFGVLAPPIALHAPAPDVLAASWLMLRETLLVPGAVPRALKEAVSTAVSEGNSCPFCVAMHSSMLSDLVGRGAVADPAARAASAWATANGSPDTGAGHPVPFPVGHAPEMVGTAVILEYLNRMVNLFLGELPLPPHVPAASMTVVRRVLVWLIKSAERRGPRPGASLDLLPAAPLPEDLRWAEGNPAIAEAYARGAAAIDGAGRRSVPSGVRESVLAHLARWDGRPMGLSRAWVEEAVAALPGDERAAGRLALLTALASYQVDQSVVDRFRERRPDDRSLIDLTSWASLAAARRVGGWMRIRAEETDAGPTASTSRST